MPTWSKRIAMSCMRKGIINEDQIPWFIYGIEKRIAFQALHSLDPDGFIGKNTWQAIAGELGVTTAYTQTTLSKGGQHVYLVDTSSTQYKFRYFTSQTATGSIFHQG